MICHRIIIIDVQIKRPSTKRYFENIEPVSFLFFFLFLFLNLTDNKLLKVTKRQRMRKKKNIRIFLSNSVNCTLRLTMIYEEKYLIYPYEKETENGEAEKKERCELVIVFVRIFIKHVLCFRTLSEEAKNCVCYCEFSSISLY